MVSIMPGWLLALAVLILFGAIVGGLAHRPSPRIASAMLFVGMLIGIMGRLVTGRMSGDINHLEGVV
jgi:uncharacterized membrane protein YeaQ/YmgE (transglycosylase-associated protein family)